MTAIHVIHREPQDFQHAIPAEQLLEIFGKTLGKWICFLFHIPVRKRLTEACRQMAERLPT